MDYLSLLALFNKKIAIYMPGDEQYSFKTTCSALDQMISGTFASSHLPLPELNTAPSCS